MKKKIELSGWANFDKLEDLDQDVIYLFRNENRAHDMHPRLKHKAVPCTITLEVEEPEKKYEITRSGFEKDFTSIVEGSIHDDILGSPTFNKLISRLFGEKK